MALGFETEIFVVTVCSHAGFEFFEFVGAEFEEDVLAGRTLIFSRKAVTNKCGQGLVKKFQKISLKKSEIFGGCLQNDSFIDEGRLFLGSTKHVDHIFHRHLAIISYLPLIKF